MPEVVTLPQQTALISPLFLAPHPSVSLKLFGSAADGKAWLRENIIEVLKNPFRGNWRISFTESFLILSGGIDFGLRAVIKNVGKKDRKCAFISSSLGSKTIVQPPLRLISCDYSDGLRHWRDARRKKDRLDRRVMYCI